MEAIIAMVYSQTISFDPANEGLTVVNPFTTLRYLDLWVYMSWGRFFFSLVYKNDLFAVLRHSSLRTKTDIPYPMVTARSCINGWFANFKVV